MSEVKSSSPQGDSTTVNNSTGPSNNTPTTPNNTNSNNSNNNNNNSYIDLQYSWCFGSGPIWTNNAFIDLFFDSVISDLLYINNNDNTNNKKRVFNSQQWCNSLELLQLVFNNILSNCPHWLVSLSPEELTNFTLILPTLAETKMYCSRANHVGSKSEEKLFETIKEIHSRLVMLAVNCFMIIPGGWINDKNNGGNVLYVIQRIQSGFIFGIVNTHNDISDGLKYHPTLILDSPQPKYKYTLIFNDIPLARLMDSSFWLFLLKLQAFPSQENTVEYLYEKLLPVLNQKPLLHTMFDNADEKSTISFMNYYTLSKGGDNSLINSVIEASSFMLRRKGFKSERVGLMKVLIEWQLLRFLYEDLNNLLHVTSNDMKIFQTACQRLASTASKQAAELGGGGLNSELLRQIQSFIESIHIKLNSMPKHTINNYTGHEFKAIKANSAGERDQLYDIYTPFPLFDRFLRTESIENLAGPAETIPIFRPIQFTSIPLVCNNLDDCMTALRSCDQICTLLSYQTETIKNTYMLRISMIQSVFTQIVPIPLPYNHTQKSTRCIWNLPMKYETQIEFLRLIRLISRHFSACSMSLKVTRSFDAARILTSAAMTAISDQLIRIRAIDSPSLFSLHMQGIAPPTPRFYFQPFGIDMGPFAKQSEYMKFTTPELISCRTQILDYFFAQSQLIKDDHLIFRFERSMESGNINKLLEQICWEIGFPHKELPKYITGERREILLNYPEILYYRDIIFTFKFMMTPTNSALPPIKSWMQSDADLAWKYNENEDKFEIFAFGQQLQYPEEQKKQREQEQQGLFARIWGLFSKDSRAGPSGADPTALVNSNIDNEEDVLHIKDLPNFGSKLTPSAVELLVSYLTAPYLRIPLILNFFATPEHIHSLGIERLQVVIDGALFEPGLWLNPITNKLLPKVIPTNDRSLFATPSGLLFNELQKSPQGLMRSLSDLLEFAIELDTGKYSPSTAPVILYVIRLIVRVEGHMLFLINYNNYHLKLQTNEANQKRNESQLMPTKSQLLESNTSLTSNGTGFRAFVRGLDLTPRQLKLLKNKRKQLRDVMNDQVYPMLDRWCSTATKSDQIDRSCILHAHLAFLFFHLPREEFTTQIVSTLLSAQIFLTTRYRYDLSAENGASYNRIKEKQTGINDGHENLLGIPDTEMFDLFQQQRPKVLNFLQSNQIQANIVMENIVKVVTMTQDKITQAQEREGFGSAKNDNNNNNNNNLYINNTQDNKENKSDELKSNQEATVDSKTLESNNNINNNNNNSENHIRHWRSMDGMNCVGRFIPDMKPRTLEEQLAAENQRQFTRGEQLVETEINIQLGSLTLNTSRLEILDSKIISMHDFKEIFGETNNQQQCVYLTTQ